MRCYSCGQKINADVLSFCSEKCRDSMIEKIEKDLATNLSPFNRETALKMLDKAVRLPVLSHVRLTTIGDMTQGICRRCGRIETFHDDAPGVQKFKETHRACAK